MSLCGGMIIVQGFYFSLRLHGNRGQCWCSHSLTTCSEQQRGTAHMGKGQKHNNSPSLMTRLDCTEWRNTQKCVCVWAFKKKNTAHLLLWECDNTDECQIWTRSLLWVVGDSQSVIWSCGLVRSLLEATHSVAARPTLVWGGYDHTIWPPDSRDYMQILPPLLKHTELKHSGF